MRKLFIASLTYLVIGLSSGVFYREFTRAYSFDGSTGLSTIHTHTLVLGTLFFLILIALDKHFELSERKQFTVWFWLYNLGLVWTVVAMFIRGIVEVISGLDAWGPAFSGISGLGHVLLAVAWVWLFRIIYVSIRGDAGYSGRLHYR
ncbi:DUF2871 domain-containing protein [Arcanobacterium phocae]|uniref:DUF2871 domain-containing protein n=1 Tax=Arcanobacterium phocae TaxID=131112 RepID=UPI001C0ED800|nr:DUF2871 domain-containing protein [Arcanobacterium phocae]